MKFMEVFMVQVAKHYYITGTSTTNVMISVKY